MNLTRKEHDELVRLSKHELAVGSLFTGSAERTWLREEGLIEIQSRPGIDGIWVLTDLGKKVLKLHTIIGEGEI